MFFFEKVLTSPIDGTVQQLATHTVGGVVTPAQALMTIVPYDGPVMIEATVENKDIGFVHAGQDVEVKVETFTFTRYGLMHGHVVDVSRDAAVVDPRTSKRGGKDQENDAEDDSANPPSNTAGYVAHVWLDQNTMNVDGTVERLKPGMAITAEIKTGQQTVISYLLSPLSQSLSNAGHEK